MVKELGLQPKGRRFESRASNIYRIYKCIYNIYCNQHTTVQKFVLIRFKSFFIIIDFLCSPRLHLFAQKYSNLKYYFNLNSYFVFEYIVKCNLFL